MFDCPLRFYFAVSLKKKTKKKTGNRYALIEVARRSAIESFLLITGCVFYGGGWSFDVFPSAFLFHRKISFLALLVPFLAYDCVFLLIL